MQNTTTDLQLIPDTNLIPSLPDDKKQQAKADSEGVGTFAKPVEGGILINNEDIVPRLVGVIVDYNRYAGKWSDGNIDKIFEVTNADDLPEGYEFRADVILLGSDYEEYTVSYPPTSWGKLAKIVTRLNNVGKDITEFAVELSTKQVSGKRGTYPVIVTRILGEAKDRPQPDPQPVVTVNDADQPIWQGEEPPPIDDDLGY